MKNRFSSHFMCFCVVFFCLLQQNNAQVSFTLPSQAGVYWSYQGSNGSGMGSPIFSEGYRIGNDTMISTPTGVKTYHNFPGSGFREAGQKVYIYTYSTPVATPFTLGYSNFTFPIGAETLIIDFTQATIGTLQTQGFFGGFKLVDISTATMLIGGTRTKYAFENIEHRSTSSSANYIEWIDGIGIVGAGFFESGYTLTTFYNQNGYLVNYCNFPAHTDNSMNCTATINAYSPSTNVWKLYNTAPRLPHTRITWQLPYLSPQPVGIYCGNLRQNLDTLTVTFPLWQYNLSGPPTAIYNTIISLEVWDSTAHCRASTTHNIGTNAPTCVAILVPIGQVGEDTILMRNISYNTTPQTLATVRGGYNHPSSLLGAPACDTLLSNAVTPVTGSTTDFLYSNACKYQVGQNHFLGGVKLLLNGTTCQSSYQYLDGSRICDDGNCVYPGDTDRDRIVNHLDLLPILANLGSNVNKRSFPLTTTTSYNYGTTDWRGQKSYGASGDLTLNCDTNSDGVVNANDISAILQNYNKTHNIQFPLQRKTQNFTQNIANTPLKAVFRTDTLNISSYPHTIAADIYLGDNTTPAQDFLGVGFSLKYTAGIVDTAYTVYDNTSWLGATPTITELLRPSTNQLDVAFGRNNRINTSGLGKIATVYFVLSDNIIYNPNYTSGNIPLALQVSNCQGINAAAAKKLISATGSTVILKNMIVGTSTSNTSNGSFYAKDNTIYTKNISENSRLLLYDITGRMVFSTIVTPEIDITDLPLGVYIAHILTENKSILTKKIVKGL